MASVAARKSEETLRRKRGAGNLGRRHLASLRPCLKKKIQVIIWGTHSPDWMVALAPSAPIWAKLDLACEVSHVDANESDLARAVNDKGYPILVPLMEPHARSVPADYACSSPAAELITLLAEKDLFAAYLQQKNFAKFAPRHYWTLEHVKYPCVVKPVGLSGGMRIEIVTGRAELDLAVARLSAEGKRFIVQSCVTSPVEYVTHAVVLDGEIQWDLTFQYDIGRDNVIRVAEITGSCKIERVQTPPPFRKVLAEIMADLHLSGPVNIDYKMIDGHPVIFEINPRLGGSLMRPENADALCEALSAVVDCAVASDRFFARVIQRSELFDVAFYTDRKNEFEPPTNDPALHYFREGFLQGRDPCDGFSSNDYTSLNLEGEQNAINPLVHFELLGRDRRFPVRRKDRRTLKSALKALDSSSSRSRTVSNRANGPANSQNEQNELIHRRAEINSLTCSKRIVGGCLWSSIIEFIRGRLDGFSGMEAAACSRLTQNLAEEPQRSKAYLSRITSAEATRIIEERKLKTVGNSWHYSWDLERFFPQLYLYETSTNSYIFHGRPIPYASAPAPLYSDDLEVDRVIAHRGRYFPYWFLHFGSFESFLQRRSLSSGKPNSNFPTQETYNRIRRKKEGVVQRLPLVGNEQLFIDQFSLWKDTRFNFDGNTCLQFYRTVNPGVPPGWFQFYLLTDAKSGIGRGVMLTIEDGRSSAMLNLANERSYGVFMIVEAFRLMADLGYSSLNAGVSGSFGYYKDVLYLDAMRSDATGLLPVGARC